MNELKALLDIRRELKEKKPAFIRQDYQRRKRLGRKLKWRKPKGIHSKIRHHFKGRRKMPSPGYKSPSKARGLHASGLKIVNVYSTKDIDVIKKDTEGMVISAQVGLKKTHEMLKKAKELGVIILNFNADEKIKKIEHFMSLKKKTHKEGKKEAKEKPEAKKEVPEPKGQGQKLTEEGKKEAEKKEKDKLLTRKN